MRSLWVKWQGLRLSSSRLSVVFSLSRHQREAKRKNLGRCIRDEEEEKEEEEEEEEASVGNDRSAAKTVTTIYPPTPLPRGRRGGSEFSREIPAQEPAAYNPKMLAGVAGEAGEEGVVIACLRLMLLFRPLTLPPVPLSLSLSLTHTHTLSLSSLSLSLSVSLCVRVSE
jgi:hypothetical protein